MKKLFYFLVLLIALFFIVDRVGGVIMKKLLEKTTEPSLVSLNYAVNDADEDVLLFGASKILHGIDPVFIEDSLGMTAYNCGISGAGNIYTQFMLLNYVLDRYDPRVIVLNISRNDFLKEINPLRYKKLAHFYSQNDVCDSFLVDVNSDKGLMLSHLYRYNEISKLILIGMTPLKKEKRVKGFEALDTVTKRVLPPQPTLQSYSESNIDSSKLEILNRFIQVCNDRNIKLVLLTLPTYKFNTGNLYEPVKKIARGQNIPFFDYNDNKLFLDKPEYFWDDVHLNAKGADVFSRIFSHDLRTYFKDNELLVNNTDSIR